MICRLDGMTNQPPAATDGVGGLVAAGAVAEDAGVDVMVLGPGVGMSVGNAGAGLAGAGFTGAGRPGVERGAGALRAGCGRPASGTGSGVLPS